MDKADKAAPATWVGAAEGTDGAPTYSPVPPGRHSLGLDHGFKECNRKGMVTVAAGGLAGSPASGSV
jgi:hypothetical protein